MQLQHLVIILRLHNQWQQYIGNFNGSREEIILPYCSKAVAIDLKYEHNIHVHPLIFNHSTAFSSCSSDLPIEVRTTYVSVWDNVHNYYSINELRVTYTEER